MKNLFAACLTLLALTACEQPNVGARASGSMAASVDDALETSSTTGTAPVWVS